MVPKLERLLFRLAFMIIVCGQAVPPDRVMEAIFRFDERLKLAVGDRVLGDTERFHYGRPSEPVDYRSGVVCCPNNYEHHEDMPDGLLRVTLLADHGAWLSYDDKSYGAAKDACFDKILTLGASYVPDIGNRLIDHDLFTPRTIRRFTGHINGAVYGSPRKIRDGRTPIENVFLCGTDQGFLGIMGAMMSGITIANLHILSVD